MPDGVDEECFVACGRTWNGCVAPLGPSFSDFGILTGWFVVRSARSLADHLEAHGRGRREAGGQLDPEVPVRCRYPREEVSDHVLFGLCHA